MDKKNFTLGALLLVAAFAILFLSPRPTPPPPAPPPAAAPANPGEAASATAAAPGATSAAPVPPSLMANVSRDAAEVRLVTLENDHIAARFTTAGGAVRDVAFKRYAALQGKPDPYIFNQLHEDPLLAFTDYPGLGRQTTYELVRSSATEVVFRHVLDGRLEVTRTYRFLRADEKGADPYRIHHETTFRNLTAATAPLGKAALSVGTAGLIDAADVGQYLNIVSSDGNETQFIERGELEGGGIGSLVGSGRAAIPFLERPGAVV